MKTQFTMGFTASRARALFFLISIFLLLTSHFANAFCGFYVAKADATLFNKTSQVILVRDGDKTTITMSSDFQGDVKDFAMVVPVPVVLKRDEIKTVAKEIFTTLDNYSSPRLVEYWDENPCQPIIEYDALEMAPQSMADRSSVGMAAETKQEYHVTIEAQYTVDEYDVLLLSAQESSGLEHWLTDNGYKIPAGAKEVLEPYINSNMKFFVVKVNSDELRKKGTSFLSPLQISFHSPKFMLPIRLGMANARGSQDMIVYAFSKQGRIETTNYRTVKLPTDAKVPEFVQNWFGKFYVDTYRKNREEEGRNNVYLEYAWNISSNVSQYCDPCNGPPPMLQDFMTAGVDWVQQYHYGYQGNVYFTRLHVTYDRKNFPQDLFFEETPNQENFQARYVVTHPVYGDFDCAEGKSYMKDVMKRRNEELNNLAILTGWDVSQYGDYGSKFSQYVTDREPQFPKPKIEKQQLDDSPEIIPNKSGDSSKMNQESFSAPFTDEHDSGNPPSHSFLIIALSTMILLVTMAWIGNANKKEAR